MEREMLIMGNQLRKLSSSFTHLALALRRERENGTQVVTRDPQGWPYTTKIKNQDGAAEPPLPFPEEE